jgi:hypothetical protein
MGILLLTRGEQPGHGKRLQSRYRLIGYGPDVALPIFECAIERLKSADGMSGGLAEGVIRRLS